MTMMVLSWPFCVEQECKLEMEAQPVAVTAMARAIHAAMEAKKFFMFPLFLWSEWDDPNCLENSLSKHVQGCFQGLIWSRDHLVSTEKAPFGLRHAIFPSPSFRKRGCLVGGSSTGWVAPDFHRTAIAYSIYSERKPREIGICKKQNDRVLVRNKIRLRFADRAVWDATCGRILLATKLRNNWRMSGRP